GVVLVSQRSRDGLLHHLRSTLLHRATTALAVGGQVGGSRDRPEDGRTRGPVSLLPGSPLGIGHRRRMERRHGVAGLRAGGIRNAAPPPPTPPRSGAPEPQ